MIETAQCPRCSGRGIIDAFGHVADGICFCCNGSGSIETDKEALIAKLTDYARNEADRILTTRQQDYAGVSYNKLLWARTFCHGGHGLQEAYPELLTHWFAVGEPAFQTAQAERLENHTP